MRVTKPDRIGRQQILQLYLSKVEASDSIDVEKLSSITIGMSGAEIESLVNTAAIKAAKDGKKNI